MSWFGVDFSHWTKPQLVAARFFFDAIFPFVLLVLFSWVTRAGAGRRARSVLRAPAHARAADARAGCRGGRGARTPTRGASITTSSSRGRNWEILKPAASDYAGFFGTWALVGVIVLMLWAMVTVR